MAGDEVLSVTRDTTDASGHTAAIVTLPREPGSYDIEAAIDGVEPVIFTVTAEVTPDFDGDGGVGFRLRPLRRGLRRQRSPL